MTVLSGAKRPGAARKAVLLGGSALLLAMMAAQAQAQCSNLSFNLGGQLGGRNTFNFGQTSSGTSSAVQSLISVLSTTNTAFLTQTSGFIGAPANPLEGQPGGGVWVRGIGGTLDTRTGASYTYGGNAFSPGGSGTCSTKTFQDYGGVQVGADISRLNINGGNFHAGVTAGYTESTIRSPSGVGSTFNGEFQTPFVGLYAAYTKDGFFVDGQARWDFFQSRLSDSTNGFFGQLVGARSFSLTGNLGKQFPLGDDWFVEPSIGGVYSMASVDRFNGGGTYYLQNSDGFAPPTSIKIRDFNSILGRASVRVGRNFIVDNFALQPFFTASVFNEFAGRVRTNINTTFDALGQSGGAPAGFYSSLDSNAVLTSQRIGTYGQFAVGIAGQILNTGWLGYVRGDYRTGDRVEGWGISGGLRYQFTPEQVVARNVVRKGYDAPPLLPAIEGPINWTGVSIGGSLGGLWSQTSESYTAVGTNPNFGLIRGTGPTRPRSDGVLAGGQVGVDYQFGQVVVGAAGDFGWTNARGARACPGTGFLFFYNCQSETNLLTMATGRVGYAWDRTLFYAKGGVAFADVTERLRPITGNEPILGIGDPYTTDRTSRTAMGWTVGGGFEFMLTKNWSAKAEYMHYELERRRLVFPQLTNGIDAASARHTGDLVRIGVNYRFNWSPPAPVLAAAPVVAKY